MRKLKKYSWYFILCVSSITNAQKYNYQSSIEGIEHEGFQRIELSPQLLGKLNNNQADLRLYDNKGKEVAYLAEQEERIERTTLFHEYEIIEKNYREDDISYLVFANPEQKEIDNVSFIVKNTDVRKRARLSGSDDGKTWYVIKNDYLLHSMHSNKETTELKILNFPLSNYSFFRLEIDDYWKIPINILKVGYYDYKSVSGKKVVFEYPIISTIDSAKTSFIKIQFPEETYIENLQFDITGADYYLRNGKVSIKNEYETKHKVTKYRMQSISSFNINSNSTNIINIGGRIVKELYIEIYNKDDQPLIVSSIKGSFLKKYIVANLDPLKQYKVHFGDDYATRPQYDLANFKNEIPDNLLTVKHSKVEKLKEDEVKNEREKGIFDNPIFIWSVIGIVGLILAFVSFRMINEIGKREL